MKGAVLIFISALALAQSEDIEVNSVGCPVDFQIHLTLSHDKYCNLFYSCVGGNRVERNCPENLVFNANEGICDWSFNVDCGGKGIFVKESEEDSEDVDEINQGGNSDPSAAPEICARQNSDGDLVAHEDCDKFYKCDRGVPVAMECPSGLFYNYNFGYCDWPLNVKCGDRVIPSAK